MSTVPSLSDDEGRFKSLYDLSQKIVIVESVFRIFKRGELEVAALQDLSMNVNSGEVLAVVGKSGSGKTTLLKIIGGLIPPTIGRVWVDGRFVNRLRDHQLVEFRRNSVGFMFQESNLFERINVQDNIIYPQILAGRSTKEAKTRAEYLLEEVDLTERRNHRPNQLSGGERQRVALATALANDPALLLADEPTGELDTESSYAIVDLIRSLAHNLNKSAIIVTHDTTVGRRVDRQLLLQDGRVMGQKLEEEGDIFLEMDKHYNLSLPAPLCAKLDLGRFLQVFPHEGGILLKPVEKEVSKRLENPII